MPNGRKKNKLKGNVGTETIRNSFPPKPSRWFHALQDLRRIPGRMNLNSSKDSMCLFSVYLGAAPHLRPFRGHLWKPRRNSPSPLASHVPSRARLFVFLWSPRTNGGRLATETGWTWCQSLPAQAAPSGSTQPPGLG